MPVNWSQQAERVDHVLQSESKPPPSPGGVFWQFLSNGSEFQDDILQVN